MRFFSFSSAGLFFLCFFNDRLPFAYGGRADDESSARAHTRRGSEVSIRRVVFFPLFFIDQFLHRYSCSLLVDFDEKHKKKDFLSRKKKNDTRNNAVRDVE